MTHTSKADELCTFESLPWPVRHKDVPARLADRLIPELARLINSSFKGRLTEDRVEPDLSDCKDYRHLVLALSRETGHISGALFIGPPEPSGCAELKLLVVADNHRSTGLATCLTREAARVAKKNGATSLRGDSIEEWNLSRLFSSTGFHLESREARPDGEGCVIGAHHYCTYFAQIADVEAALRPTITRNRLIKMIVGGIAAVAFFTVYLPGLISHAGGSFTEEAIADHDTVRETIDSRNAKPPSYKSIDAQTRAALTSAALSATDAKTWLETDELLRPLRAPRLVWIRPFISSQLNQFFWPVFLGGMLCIATLLSPVRGIPKGALGAITWLTPLAYITYAGLGYVRSFFLASSSRSIYSYANFDIDPLSWAYQELEHLGFFLLLIVIWFQWAEYDLRQRNILRRWEEKPLRVPARCHELGEILSATYTRWQLAAGTASIVFVAIFFFFWQSVGLQSDSRYIASAFIIQCYGIATLALISMPAVRAMTSFRRFKTRVLVEAWDDQDKMSARHQVLSSLAPVNPWNAGFSAFIVLVSALAPVVKLIAQ